jgi:hypothetical protein
LGTLNCQRCGAKAEGNSQDEADELIDHARGQMIGRPCEGKQSDLSWTGGTTVAPRIVVEETITESKSSKKTKKSKRG